MGKSTFLKSLQGVRPMEGVIFERWARLNSLRSMEGVVLERWARLNSLRPMEGMWARLHS